MTDQNSDSDMNQQFEQIVLMSKELQSLIRQGVKNGISERIQARDQCLRQWFDQVASQMQLAQEQESALADILETEKALLQQLQQEQKKLANQQAGRRKSSEYQKIGRTH